jgi:hypothetical protein
VTVKLEGTLSVRVTLPIAAGPAAPLVTESVKLPEPPTAKVAVAGVSASESDAGRV